LRVGGVANAERRGRKRRQQAELMQGTCVVKRKEIADSMVSESSMSWGKIGKKLSKPRSKIEICRQKERNPGNKDAKGRRR